MSLTLEGLDRRVTALERAQNDTTETLKWVVSKLGRLQAVQEEHTLRLDRIEEKVDRLENKVDRLENKVDRLEEKVTLLAGTVDALPRVMAEMIAQSETRLVEMVKQSEQRFTDKLAQSETRLLEAIRAR